MPNLRSTRRKRRRSTPLRYLNETSASGIYWPSPLKDESKKMKRSPAAPKVFSKFKDNEATSSPDKENVEIKSTMKKTKKAKAAKTSKKKSSKKVDSKAWAIKQSKKKSSTKSSTKFEASGQSSVVAVKSIRQEKALLEVTSIRDSGHFLEYRSEITTKNDDSYWASAQEQSESWICYQFDEPARPTEIGIRDRNDQMAPKTIKVEVSTDSGNPDGPWITVLKEGDLSQSTPTQDGNIKWLPLDLSNVPLVRFIRVTFLENFGSKMHYVVKQVLFKS